MRRNKKDGQRSRGKREYFSEAFENNSLRSRTGEPGLRRTRGEMSTVAMIPVAKSALGLLHRLTGGMKIVAGRNHREQKDQNATQRTEKNERGAGRAIGQTSLPPQRIGGQQQGDPAKIKKKFHGAKRRGARPNALLETILTVLDDQHSIASASDLGTLAADVRGLKEWQQSAMLSEFQGAGEEYCCAQEFPRSRRHG